MSHPRSFALVAATALCLLTLTGCGGSGSAASHTQAADLSVHNMWVKSAKSGAMTAAFGTLKNSSGSKVTITAAASSVSPMMQLHETVMDSSGNMNMQQEKGGFPVPADGHFTLQPGGSHIMFMGLKKTLAAGDQVSITLTCKDGSKKTFDAVVKDFAGANENYSGGKSSATPTPSATASSMSMK